MRALPVLLLLIMFEPSIAWGQTSGGDAAEPTKASSNFRSAEDGWLDVSEFLNKKYGFLPAVIPITEPAVGYGAVGVLAFISSPLGKAREGFGRPDITAVGAGGTENGTWFMMAADVRHWFDDQVQTLAVVIDSSVNLDFYGIGKESALSGHPLAYNLEPKGGMLQGKYRFEKSRFWMGLGYTLATTRVQFDAPSGTAGLPEFKRDIDVGGLSPSLTYDSRDNIFTPNRGTYAELKVGMYSEALGGDDEFQIARFIAMQFVPLVSDLYLGVRGDGAASFGDVPFYMHPFVSLRGAPVMRYQGEEVAHMEAELRWQFWGRFSLVGFMGCGAAWNDFERLDETQTLVTGGTGFRYEIARKYNLHMGLDVAFGPDDMAVYVQIGSAWLRP